MQISLNDIGEIIKRAPHEPPVFIAQLLNLSEYQVEKIMKEHNIQKLPREERIESVEYIAYRSNIDVEYLRTIIRLVKKFKMPLPRDFSDNLVLKIRKLAGPSLSHATWQFFMDRVTLEQLDYILSNYFKFTNNTIIRDLKIENSKGLMSKIQKAYYLTKPAREDLYCEVCRVEHLPPAGYKSNTSCKICWSKRMSEYQYIYYPNKKAKQQ